MQFVFSLGGVQCTCTFQELKLETNIWKLKQTFSKLVLVFPNETVPLLNLCKFDINRLLLVSTVQYDSLKNRSGFQRGKRFSLNPLVPDRTLKYVFCFDFAALQHC